MIVNDFSDNLSVSKGKRLTTDTETIKKFIAGCVSVTENKDLELDKMGVDFIATLRGGASLNIDLKSREAGASKYWKGEPELALEVYSDVERKTTGWTLDESKVTDYVYYVFADVDVCFFVPFQLLRLCFRDNFKSWENKYKIRYQYSKRSGASWQSSAMFVPASVVLEAVKKRMVIE